MPHPAHSAVARRDNKLSRIRRLTLWITGGAAAASLGLGTAFAHALPGHSYTTRSTATTGSTSSYRQASQGSPGQQPAPHRPASGGHRSSRAASHPQHQKLATPTQAPAPAPSTPRPAPVVSSGGS